jgi:hypothetical protein
MKRHGGSMGLHCVKKKDMLSETGMALLFRNAIASSS